MMYVLVHLLCILYIHTFCTYIHIHIDRYTFQPDKEDISKAHRILTPAPYSIRRAIHAASTSCPGVHRMCVRVCVDIWFIQEYNHS